MNVTDFSFLLLEENPRSAQLSVFLNQRASPSAIHCDKKGIPSAVPLGQRARGPPSRAFAQRNAARALPLEAVGCNVGGTGSTRVWATAGSRWGIMETIPSHPLEHLGLRPIMWDAFDSAPILCEFSRLWQDKWARRHAFVCIHGKGVLERFHIGVHHLGLIPGTPRS